MQTISRLNQDHILFAGPPCTPDDIDIFGCADCGEKTQCRADVWIDKCWDCESENIVFLATVHPSDKWLVA